MDQCNRKIVVKRSEKFLKYAMFACAVLLLGCEDQDPALSGKYELVDAPFSNVTGDHSRLPFLLGWQCEGGWGRIVDEKNGYRMFVSNDTSFVNGDELSIVSVQPPGWPCAYSVVSSNYDRRRDASAFMELAEIFEEDGAYYVSSHYEPLRRRLNLEQLECMQSGEGSPRECAERLTAPYQGIGVTFRLSFPHEYRTGTAYQLGVKMNGETLTIRIGG